MISNIFLNWDISTYLVAGVVFIVSFVLLKRQNKNNRKYPNLPRGPLPLPIFGTLYGGIFLNYERDMSGLKRDFGPVTLLYSGNIPVVMLNTIEAAKEAFLTKAHVLSDRYIIRIK